MKIIANNSKKFGTFCFIFLGTTIWLLSFWVNVVVRGVGIWANILAHSKRATLNMIVSTNVITARHNNYNYWAITQAPHPLPQPYNTAIHVNWHIWITTDRYKRVPLSPMSPTYISFVIEIYVSVVNVALLNFQVSDSVSTVDLIYVYHWMLDILWCLLNTVRTFFSSWSRAVTNNNLMISEP
jgi:hypothetical protein